MINRNFIVNNKADSSWFILEKKPRGRPKKQLTGEETKDNLRWRERWAKCSSTYYERNRGIILEKHIYKYKILRNEKVWCGKVW